MIGCLFDRSICKKEGRKRLCLILEKSKRTRLCSRSSHLESDPNSRTQYSSLLVVVELSLQLKRTNRATPFEIAFVPVFAQQFSVVYFCCFYHVAINLGDFRSDSCNSLKSAIHFVRVDVLGGECRQADNTPS